MPKTTFLGHPHHPRLILVCGGLLPIRFTIDLAQLATGKRGYADAACSMTIGGTACGIAPAAVGVADYLKIPNGGPALKVNPTATAHGLMNTGELALCAIELAPQAIARADGAEDGGGTGPVSLSAIGTLGLLVSAWYGAHLVYKYRVRVAPTDPMAKAPAVKPPAIP